MIQFDVLDSMDGLLEFRRVWVFDEGDELAELLEIPQGFFAGHMRLGESRRERVLRGMIEWNFENENVHF